MNDALYRLVATVEPLNELDDVEPALIYSVSPVRCSSDPREAHIFANKRIAHLAAAILNSPPLLALVESEFHLTDEELEVRVKAAESVTILIKPDGIAMRVGKWEVEKLP